VLAEESLTEEAMPVAGIIIGEHAEDGEAEARVMRPCHKEEAQCRAVALVGQDRCEGEPGVVLDGDMQVLPTGTTAFAGAVAMNAMTRLDDAGQSLDVEMDEIAGMLVLVADHLGRRVE